MNKEQKKILELLIEFDTFCKDNKIKYCLCGETLMYGLAKGTISPRPCGACVIMTGDNVRKFIECFEKKAPANREIEYWGNSAVYPDYTVRYVASDTTSFNLIDCLNYNSHGMFIEIDILRGEKRGRNTRNYYALESGIKLNAYNEATKRSQISGRKDSIYDKYYKAVSVVSSKNKIRKQLFDYFSTECVKPVSQGKGVSGLYSFIYRGRRFKDISQNYFGQLATCEIEGHTFPIPRSARTFLRRMFSTRYSCSPAGDRFTETFSYVDNCIIDVDTPYAETFSKLELTKDELVQIYKSKARIDEINGLNKENNAVAKNDWLTVQQTGARFRMWKKYMPMKDEIIRLHKAGDYKALNTIFEDYKEELEEFKADKRSFSFDNEIFDIFIDMLEHQGHFKEADRIIRMLPKSHLKDIDLKLEGQNE